jgi:4-diphosphocytidyl-2-C-methyl-D-erythritol kinase
VTRFAALAPGKVNLCLFVGRPGADGPHPLVSILQPVTLADELVLEPGADADEVLCPGVEGPNLAARALALYREASGWDGPPLRLTIRKHVPVAAGMGGGSSDAAAALRLVAAAAGRPGDPLLRALAPRLGSDVLALLEPRRALVTGTGERVEPQPATRAGTGERVEPQPAILGETGEPCGLVIIPSAHALSTADVYREADRLGVVREPEELARLAVSVRAGAEPAVNDLERPAISLCPAIEPELAAVRAAGAERALVSGSGPTVFGVFADPERARAAAEELRAEHPRALTAGPAPPNMGAVRALP